MRGSLVHDALYQLLLEKLIPLEKRENADGEFKRFVLKMFCPRFALIGLPWCRSF